MSVPMSNNSMHKPEYSLEDFVLTSIVSIIVFVEYFKNLARQDKISISEIEQIINSPGENRLDLYHKENRGCIFDLPENDEIVSFYSLENYRLCTACQAKLESTSLGTTVIASAQKILASIRKPTLLKSFLSILNNPLLSFIFGGLIIAVVVNILTTLVQSYAWLIIVIMGISALIMIFGKYFIDLINAKQ